MPGYRNTEQNPLGSTVEVSELESLAKGALIAGDGSGAPSTLTVGANETELVADSAQATGVKWLAAATAAEINTGTDTEKRVTPDALAGSVFGVRQVQLVVFDFATANAVGDGKSYFHIDDSLNGMNLVRVHAEVITAGTTGTLDIQIANVTSAVDILSTKLTVDSAETGSDTAATAAVINTSNDSVSTNDVLRIDVDAIHTTPAQGLIVTLVFQLP